MSVNHYDAENDELTRIAGSTRPVDTMVGATASAAGSSGKVPTPLAGDQDKVLQGNGNWGKKLQVDIVTEDDQVGYINGSNQFIPFKSQADVSAAAAAARVGNATAADVLVGKTFTNASGSGLTGELVMPESQEKTVTAGDSIVIVTPDSGKWLSKVNVNPKERFQVGRLSTRKNIDGWSDNTWSVKRWNSPSSFSGNSIWTDGTNIYHSSNLVLDKSTSTWSAKTWSGLRSFSGQNIWTDGTDIYYSDGSIYQYVLDKSTSTWITKTWSGLTDFEGRNIWIDGSNIYLSCYSDQYVLDKSTSTWITKTWSGLTDFEGRNIWTDGSNIYYSDGSTQYVLNKSNSTWSTKTWNGLTSFSGNSIWTDGTNIYYSSSSTQYVLNKSNSTWSAKTWSGLTSFSGLNVWSDGTNIYYSSGSTQYVLQKAKTKWSV